MAGKASPYDPVAGLYDRAFDSIDLRRREYAWFLERAQPGREDTLVEVGCGNGRLLAAAAPLVKKAVGVDPSAEMVRLARENLAGLRNARVKQAPGEKTGLPAARADIVVSFFSFRYLDWEKGLKEMLRLLKPGGRLVIIDMFENRRPARRLPALFVAKARTMALILRRPRAHRALRRLARDPAWAAMLRACPLRGLDAFRRLVVPRFPLARFEELDLGARARTVAFHSGPIDLFAAGRRRGFPAVAVMDWGIGGLGFFTLLKAARPRVPVLYFSDAGFTPYGRVSDRNLRRRLRAIVEFLKLNGVTRLVVACNAMSTVLDGFDPGPGFALAGVIRPAVEYLRSASWKQVGVIGGNRTIRSGAFRKALRGSGIAVKERATQRLSAFIERGDTTSAAFEVFLARALRPVREVELLVLACTHYPAAERRIRALVKGRLLDPARLALEWVEERWPLKDVPAGRDVFVTTGDPPRTAAGARAMFGVALRGLRKIEL
jgi:glutamate racemase